MTWFMTKLELINLGLLPRASFLTNMYYHYMLGRDVSKDKCITGNFMSIAYKQDLYTATFS